MTKLRAMLMWLLDALFNTRIKYSDYYWYCPRCKKQLGQNYDYCPTCELESAKADDAYGDVCWDSVELNE